MVFMAWSAFGWLGVAYIVIVPIPLVFFSWLIRRGKKRNGIQANSQISLWTSPIPYLSIIFVAFVLFNIIV
jgi:heme/copper-type cytochrome/quinol oxidase subunit 2